MDETAVVTELLGYFGRCFGSKSEYHRRFPENVVSFNANVFLDDRKVWWGDVDLTLSWGALKELAVRTGKRVRVLPEMAARFHLEANPAFDQALVDITASEGFQITLSPYFEEADGTIKARPREWR